MNNITPIENQAKPLVAQQQFELVQRKAKAYASSTLVPDQFRNNMSNCVIAMEMAQRLDMQPLMVMQNMYIVHGKPAFSSTFIIACINASGRFSPLRFKYIGEGDDRSCVAYCKDKQSGDTLESIPVSIAMAKKEGWAGKRGSKWDTMPDLMLQYRAATFFGRAYAPDYLMGLHTKEEIQDVGPIIKQANHPQTVSEILKKTDHDITEVEIMENKPVEDHE